VLGTGLRQPCARSEILRTHGVKEIQVKGGDHGAFEPERISERTQTLLRKTLCWDNHACMPLRPGDTSFLPQLERVRSAGVDVISLNVSFDVVDPRDAFLVLATFRHWIRQHSDRYVLVNSVADVEGAKAKGQLAVVFDIEGGNAVAAHPGLVEVFYQLGVRWMLLAYNKNNALGGGCMDDDSGLTAYGRQTIDEMEGVGMVLCCTHVGPRTAREAMEHARNPVIFSHSNPFGVYRHVRNIPDDLMTACARGGGVVNINGVGLFLGVSSTGAPDNSTETLLRHIDYAVQLIGPQHVGIGLDYVFDLSELSEYLQKSPESFPPISGQARSYTQVEPERFPLIAEALLKRGYQEEDVQGILGQNNLRIARQVWK
jgi:membrane dipeptidase